MRYQRNPAKITWFPSPSAYAEDAALQTKYLQNRGNMERITLPTLIFSLCGLYCVHRNEQDDQYLAKRRVR